MKIYNHSSLGFLNLLFTNIPVKVFAFHFLVVLNKFFIQR